MLLSLSVTFWPHDLIFVDYSSLVGWIAFSLPVGFGINFYVSKRKKCKKLNVSLVCGLRIHFIRCRSVDW